MRRLLPLVVVLLALVGCKDPEPAPAGSETEAPARTAEPMPELAQAEPVWRLILAARDEDLETFKGLWSKARTEEMQKDWKAAFDEWSAEVLRGAKPGFTLKDYTFSYEGDATSGRVGARAPWHENASCKVVLEDGRWRLDEQ